jgi:hypothetical protein
VKRVQAAIFFLLAWATAADAFNFSYQPDGSFTHWTFATPNPSVPTNSFDPATHAIRYYISSAAWSTTNTANEINAVRNCFGQWQSVPNTVIKFEEGGLVAPGYDVNTADNTNVVYWATNLMVDGGADNISGSLGVTFKTWFTSPPAAAGVISQFDIVLNGVQDGWFTDFNDQNNTNYFVEGTLAHEIGHSLGLTHAAIGGATMLWEGQSGVDTQAGLSVDEVAFGRTLYPSGNILSTLANLTGTVTKSGSPVLGAAVIIEGTNGNLAGGTVSLTNGTYVLNSLPPGPYNVRVVPLDPTSASRWLITGPDISNPQFSAADPNFFPTGNTPVTLTAGTTNTQNFIVTNGTPAFRITDIRKPTSDPNSYSIIGEPQTIKPGQSNYTFGVFSPDLPTNAASLTVTGDGLTLGAPTFQPGNIFGGLNGIAVSISVSSNATPGLRTIIVTQGTNVAYANGFLEVLPLIPDYNFDGLDDTFQRKYFFPFTSTNAAPNADPDGDGVINSIENIMGTDPTDPNSLLKMTSITRAANGATVVWESVTNRHYQVFSRTNLTSGAWQAVGGVITPTGASTQYLDTTGTNGTRFYRVQVLP